MILYFSGSGNSRLVASRIADLLHERLANIEDTPAPILADDEPLGIVFPVYAWGLPRIVDRYLRSLTTGERFLWAVMTCGDDMGYADRCLAKALGRSPDAVFSVAMPNTYVCLPGFKVDSDEVARRKVSSTIGRLPAIAQLIGELHDASLHPAALAGRRKVCRQLHRGLFPLTKTYVLRPFFNRFLVTDRHFHTTASCTSCGLCARQCPMADIKVDNDAPQWGHKDCTGCLRCFHKCPHRAIEWGRYTKGKSQVQHLADLHADDALATPCH